MFQASLNKIYSNVVKAVKKIPMKRVAALACMALFCAISTYAQGKGAGGFNSAITEVSSYQKSVSDLMKAIAAVIAVVGAFNVYFKMQNGDQDVKKTIMLLLMKLNFRQRKIFKMI